MLSCASPYTSNISVISLKNSPDFYALLSGTLSSMCSSQQQRCQNANYSSEQFRVDGRNDTALRIRWLRRLRAMLPHFAKKAVANMWYKKFRALFSEKTQFLYLLHVIKDHSILPRVRSRNVSHLLIFK
jgi:hypothetical protein